MSNNTLTITDNRTGKQYEVGIENDTIKALDLRKIKVTPDDFGLMTYDPAFMNTASCKSRITFIDGDEGILEYRGFPIDQLAEKSSYLEVAYLLLHGELPSEVQMVMSISFLMRSTASQMTSRSRRDGPRVAVTMQYFQARARLARRAPSTISSTVWSG